MPLPDGVFPEGKTGAKFPFGLENEKVAGHVFHRETGFGFGPFPFLRVKTRELRLLPLNADVAFERLAHFQIEDLAIGKFKSHVPFGLAVDLNLFGSEVAGNSVLDMNHIITGLQIGDFGEGLKILETLAQAA